MGLAQKLSVKQGHFLWCATGIAAIFLVAPGCRAQTTPAATPDMPWSKDLNKYPGLLPEFGKLIEKLQRNIQFPAARSESHLVALLPESTMSYAAFSNYGDVTGQALKIFRKELQESAVLHDWWQHGDLAAAGPKLEDSLEKFSQLHQFLGEEIVVAGSLEGRDPSLLLVAEVRKPGLKKFLQETIAHLDGESKQGVRVLDLQELAAAKDTGSSQGFIVLVRPDYVVAAVDLATLRSFNARLDRHDREFVSTPFGQRVVKEYEGGLTVLAAADVQKIMDEVPAGARQNETFQRSGFADAKYLVWEHKNVAGRDISQTELSFIAPRHGSASWLAKSGPLNSLNFVSPKAIVAGTVLLNNPAQIFEDLKELESTSSANPIASLEAFEKILKLSVKDDLLSTLGGELTVELDTLDPPKPGWRAILSVRDVSHLQQTLSVLLAAGHVEAQRFEDGGVTYNTLRIPSSAPMEIGYTFVDGYLVIGSSRELVAEAVRLHKTGESLGKSKTLLAALPSGHALKASALIYQDPIAMTALRLRQVAPEMAESLAQISRGATPAVVCVYGEESSIHEASSSGAYDLGAVLVVAAIAIPNLLRSRIAANEASAVGSVRTVNTAQVVYEGVYPQRGYAPDLATLGIDPRGPAAGSEAHAGLISETLANGNCTDGAWCTKSGYHFTVRSICKQHLCKEYVVVATPVDSNTGTRNFCSTSDAIVRYKPGSPLASPLSVVECKGWSPLHLP
jgi:type IV pilus assembly protein PilA